MSLLNPILVHTGIIDDLHKPVDNIWSGFTFSGNLSYYLINYIMPITVVLLIAFSLKNKYQAKKKRELDQIIDALEADAANSYLLR